MIVRELILRQEINYTCGNHENMCSWWHGLVRGACQSDLTGPLLFLVSTQPCVCPCLNIKAALSVDLYASIQAILFCLRISSGPFWGSWRIL